MRWVILGAFACAQVEDVIEPPEFHPIAEPGEMMLMVPPHWIRPGDEVQRCWEMAFPSDVDVDLNHIRWDFAGGSHHLHVYVSKDGSTAGAAQDYDCFQAVDFEKWSLLVASQDPKLEWKLPEGTAFRVKARQAILIQTHYLNTEILPTPEAWAMGTVRFRAMPSHLVTNRAAAIFGQNRDISIPAKSKHHVEAECQLPAPGEFIAMTGHFHTHGQRFDLFRLRPGNEPETLYEAIGFKEPVWKLFDGEARFEEGDRFRWTCDYVNDSDLDLPFGPREDIEEHCNLFAFFRLDKGHAEFLPCVWTGR